MRGVQMKKISIIAILVIAVFLAGCASQEISSAGEKTATKTTTKTTTTPEKTTTTTKTTTSAPSGSEEDEGRIITDEGHYESDIERQVSASGTTLTKLRTNIREKGATEKCDMPFPLACTDYLANDGIIYITIKNQGYTSKIDNVVLTLSGDECDPVSTYIEPGQIKEFECFEDANVDYVSGPLVMTYHSNIEQRDFTKTGSIVVMME
jgi:hypothetical protein